LIDPAAAPTCSAVVHEQKRNLAEMRTLSKPLMLALLAFAGTTPAAAQNTSPPAPAAQPSPFASMFTHWNGVARESLAAEEEAARRNQAEQAAAAQGTATPAMARNRTDAEALGERVGETVRDGDCENGERLARQAGDFALVQAVREHCRPRRAPNG
jgi:hypothetical protein